MSGDFTDYASAIRTRLQEFTALPHFWPNDVRDAASARDGFIYSEIEVFDEKQVSLGGEGSRRHRDWARLTAIVYVPARTLAGTAEGYAQQIRALFKSGAVEGVCVTRRTIGTGQGLDSTAGAYWGVPVYVDFWADRIE